MSRLCCPSSWVLLLAFAGTVWGSIEPERYDRNSVDKMHHSIENGIPFIVTDATADWGMSKWTCDYLSEHWGDVEIKAFAYTSGVKKSSLKKMRQIADNKKLMNITLTDQSNFTGEPSIASFLWHPIDNGGDVKLNETELARLYSEYSVPYFLPDNAVNLKSMRDRFETFIGLPASGATIHIDEMCSPIMSAQLSGNKRWVMAPYPGTGDTTCGGNVAVEAATWEPLYDTIVKAGELLVFPPGYVHQTYAVEGCSVSTSLQFLDPYPSVYIRKEMPKLTHSEELMSCFLADWNPIVFGELEGSSYRGGARKWANAMFNTLDTNKDGKVTEEELIAHRYNNIDKDHEVFEENTYIKKKKHNSASVEAKRLSELIRGALLDRAPLHGKSFVKYHDMDGDGIASRDEVVTNLIEYAHEMADGRHNLTKRSQDPERPAMQREGILPPRVKASSSDSDDEDDEDYEDEEEDDEEGEFDYDSFKKEIHQRLTKRGVAGKHLLRVMQALQAQRDDTEGPLHADYLMEQDRIFRAKKNKLLKAAGR